MSFAGSPYPSTSLKNTPLSPASQSLGLGDQLQTQLQDQLDEVAKKKKTDAMANTVGDPLNPASSGISAAVASLLGSNTGGG